MQTEDRRLMTNGVTVYLRKTTFFLCLLSLVFCLQSAFALEWFDHADGYARAHDQTVSAHKPMMVYFYTDWCPYCRKFEKNVLADAEVQKALSEFVLVRVNPEKGERENQLGDQYRLRGFPSVYFQNPASEKKAWEIGGAIRNPKSFISAVHKFNSKK